MGLGGVLFRTFAWATLPAILVIYTWIAGSLGFGVLWPVPAFWLGTGALALGLFVIEVRGMVRSVGRESIGRLRAVLPGSHVSVQCPQCRGHAPLLTTIAHLNDTVRGGHGWDRDAIAAWTDTLPVSVTQVRMPVESPRRAFPFSQRWRYRQ